jgi:hypothetical protein
MNPNPVESYGFIYMTYGDVSKSLIQYYMKGVFSSKLLKLKFYYNKKFDNYVDQFRLYNFPLVCQLFEDCIHKKNCTTIHRWVYKSSDNAIDKFIKNNPNIKYDRWKDIIDMENDYDTCYDFWNDYYDRLLNMGILDPNMCHEIYINQ